MKKRWMVMVAGLIGIISIMGTSATVTQVRSENKIYKSIFLDTVPQKKKDTTSYPKKDTMRLTQESFSN